MTETVIESVMKIGPSDIAESRTVLFGKYDVGKLLGCGAFAKVYHARDVRTGQSVAIKAVSKNKILKGGLSAHVKREITIMRKLRHPNIVRMIEVMATKSKIYYVIEFAKGGELFAKVSKGRFSENLSRRYFQQLISAIGFCHSRGVFHRDLKPENLLLDENWDLKRVNQNFGRRSKFFLSAPGLNVDSAYWQVTDFGLSAVSDQTRADGLFHTLCGTPAYVAPEILAKKGYDGAKVDIWSCGIILFVLNAGYLPFNDPNLMVMYRKIYKGEFRCPKWMSPDLKRFLSRLLDTNPETRISVNEIMNDPWFRKDYKKIKVVSDDLVVKERDESKKFLNAFDIISFSTGFDVSGLFGKIEGSSGSERFISELSSENLIREVEQIAKGEGLNVMRKKDWGLKAEGHNGNFIMVVEVYRLTERLVVVEIERRENGNECDRGIWKDKLKTQLNRLIYHPEGQSSR